MGFASPTIGVVPIISFLTALDRSPAGKSGLTVYGLRVLSGEGVLSAEAEFEGDLSSNIGDIFHKIGQD